MPLAPISGGLPSINFELLKQANGASRAATTGTAGGDSASKGQAFGDAITGALNHLNMLQNRTDTLAQQAATGELKSPADYMIAATESQLTTQLTVAVRNKAVEVYNEIIKMQV